MKIDYENVAKIHDALNDVFDCINTVTINFLPDGVTAPFLIDEDNIELVDIVDEFNIARWFNRVVV